jgi:hypothetical protein
MIPFQLHRRIPLIRRPFYQRDALAVANAALKESLAKVERERDALRALAVANAPLNPSYSPPNAFVTDEVR